MFFKFLKNRKFTIILVVVVLVVIGYAGVKWHENKMRLVDQGLASPKFPYHEYSLLELMRIRPGGDLNDEMRAELEKQLKNLPTRTTPQETFDMYIQALKDGDIEGALDYLEKEPGYSYGVQEVSWKVSEGDREYLYDIKEEGELEDMIKDLEGIRMQITPEMSKIQKGSTGEIVVRYQYQCKIWGGELDMCYFVFTKNLWGDWEIPSTFLRGSPIL